MIELNEDIQSKLSSKGTLAYVAVIIAGNAVATTAALAATVRCTTAAMSEGLKELAVEAPTLPSKASKTKWKCGDQTITTVQNLDSERYRAFVDDLKKYWDYVNQRTGVEFAIVSDRRSAHSDVLKCEQEVGSGAVAAVFEEPGKE